MKRWEIFLGIVVFILAALIVPRQIWLHGKRERFHQLTSQIPQCRTISCMTQLATDMHALNDEIDNRPWYVWGDVNLK